MTSAKGDDIIFLYFERAGRKMKFKEYLIESLKKHPSIMPRDVAKLCYQAAMGAEHLLMDASAARKYFDAEFDVTDVRDGELFECLSDDVCRVDLGAWKKTGMPKEWLFNMFVGTASVSRGGRDVLEKYLEDADEVIAGIGENFPLAEWRNFAEEYRAKGMPAVHHSDAYRELERPAYRIVDRGFIVCLPILLAASRIKVEGDTAAVIAIDGRAASGKTTIADRLARIMSVDVIRADDFFLPPALRTAERLSEIGGNLHYERFFDEVLPNVAKPAPFSYGVFDCSIMDIGGERAIGESRWRIVEGSYSHHPKFGDYADLRVFCTVDPEEQMRRILARNGEIMAARFKNEWIPMEEKYFLGLGIREGADLVI